MMCINHLTNGKSSVSISYYYCECYNNWVASDIYLGTRYFPITMPCSRDTKVCSFIQQMFIEHLL